MLVYKQIEIIALLKNNEEEVQKLYELFAGLFPDYQEFWLGLAREEERHAQWLELLEKKIENGKLYFDEKRFTIEAIKLFLNYLGEKTALAKAGKLDLQKALGAAVNIEGGLIEQKFFEVFTTDDLDLQQIFNNLARETKTHYEKVLSLLKKLGFRQEEM